jgi:hypothetical protein
MMDWRVQNMYSA